MEESEIDPRQLNYTACFGRVLTRLRPGYNREAVERIKRRERLRLNFKVLLSYETAIWAKNLVFHVRGGI